jgi:hypothetical protein
MKMKPSFGSWSVESVLLAFLSMLGMVAIPALAVLGTSSKLGVVSSEVLSGMDEILPVERSFCER